MSASLETQNGIVLPATIQPSQQDLQSDPDDGSSSLSDIEDKEAEQEDLESFGSDDENKSQYDQPVEDGVGMDEEANDSEAETERLDDSPHKLRMQRDVVINSQTESRIYERSPSKLQEAFTADGDDDVDDLSDAPSIPESAKSLTTDKTDNDLKTTDTPLELFAGDEQQARNIGDRNNKKRKRSQLVDRGSAGADDAEEHARKRKGSVARHNEEYAIDDTTSTNGDPQASNPMIGEMSDAESGGHHSEHERADHNDAHEDGTDDEAPGTRTTEEVSPSKAGQVTESTKDSTKQVADTGDEHGVEEAAVDEPDHESREGEDADDMADAEADEAEAALKNEEERTFSVAYSWSLH